MVMALLCVAGCGQPPPPGGYPSASSTETKALVDDWALIRDRLTAQGTALLSGDESGWLAAVDPDNADLVGRYRQMFHTLRGLHVTRWEPIFRDRPGFDLAAAKDVAVGVRYAFTGDERGAATAPPAGATEDLTLLMDFARRGPQAQYLISDLRIPAEDIVPRPLPWETTAFTFADGRRVTVAAPPGQQARLSAAVAAGDRAATATDRYATLVGQQPPARYIVYLAGPTEWKAWRSGAGGKNYAGYAYPGGSLQYEVVVRTEAAGNLTKLLRHEFGHVVTLSGSQLAPSVKSDDAWLIEGVAEYIAAGGGPKASDPKVLWARRWHKGKPRMRVLDRDQAKPKASASAGEVASFYGTGHLSVDCMVRRYGQRRMFDFFTAVVRKGEGLYDAAPKVYQTSWDTVQRDCVDDIYRVFGR
ncbi:hypothetical protein [Micromonospora sp. DT233]|uniref:hypothetical protein n=1 Tax=Micromonospora sp. DT233 TaxID=3393432 RepID=UPI003CEDA91F